MHLHNLPYFDKEVKGGGLMNQLKRVVPKTTTTAENQDTPPAETKTNLNVQIQLSPVNIEEAETLLNTLINSEMVELVMYNARPSNPGIEDWGEVRDKANEPISLELESGKHTWENTTDLIKDCIQAYRLQKKQPDMKLSISGGKSLPVTLGITAKGNVSFRTLKVLNFTSGEVVGFTKFNQGASTSFGRT